MVWSDQINESEASALCTAWRQQGHTTAADLRARLTAEARQRRWWIGVRVRWSRAMGRAA